VADEAGPQRSNRRRIGLLVAVVVVATGTAVGIVAVRSGGDTPQATSGRPSASPASSLASPSPSVTVTPASPSPTASPKPPPEKPDIYYIVLDEYSGRRALETQFDFDIEPFFEALRSRGLYVADQATANYARTLLSLASSLNLDYIQQLVQPVPADQSEHSPPLDELLNYPKAPKLLQRRGYTYHFLGSWWLPNSPTADESFHLGTTADAAANLGIQLPTYDGEGSRGKFNFDLREWVRAQAEFAELSRLKGVPGPKFVFAHFTCPHPPLVFDRKGRFVDAADRAKLTLAQSYTGQVRWVNGKVLALLDDLLLPPEKNRPVIIIQSDEGFLPGLAVSNSPDRVLQAHFPIMEAFYLPGLSDPPVYPTITPVNVFRLVFDQYFDAGMPMLPDRNYAFPDLDHVYTYADVTDRVLALSR
jgi:hypothetical protein